MIDTYNLKLRSRVHQFVCVLGVLALGAPMAAYAGGPNLFSGSDPVIAVNADGRLQSSYPAAESPINGLDQATSPFTKYLNFGKSNSGFIIDLSTAVTPQSFIMRSGNDAPERDPTSWELFGFNGTVTETDNGQGLADAWVSIASGSDTGLNGLVEPARDTLGALQSFTNTTAYDSFKMIFPTVRDENAANSMQFDDILFFSDQGTTPLTATPSAVLAVDADPPSSPSSYPAAESPAAALDGDLNTKYLNFGGANSGLIVTSSAGAVIADCLNLITASSPGQGEMDRNPLNWEVYGTNDAITSSDNSLGLEESWTLLGSGLTGFDQNTAPSTASGDLLFSNTTAYSSYRVVFPEIANSGIMQIGEISLSAVPEPASASLMLMAAVGILGLGRRRRRA